ncbi:MULTISPECIES: hypothetical protein [Niastella]|uniref:Uncharacterized protein n=1 Tax=Niastella soli TaxID=2821487 RepID=A0ABS3Z3I2_9BACT|nr:hypothetical protein [Niastella soli]MBO9204728.1 hypothetical protein [Niastella soli]
MMTCKSLQADGRWQTADGRRQTADGRWQTADGRRQMADGRRQMADGRWQTAENTKTCQSLPRFAGGNSAKGGQALTGQKTIKVDDL